MYVLVSLINLKSSTLWKLVAAVGVVLLLLFYMTDQCQYWFKSFNSGCMCVYVHAYIYIYICISEVQTVLKVSQNLRASHVLVRLNMHTGALSCIWLFILRQKCDWWILFSSFQTKLWLVGFIFTISDKAGIGGFYFHHFRQSWDWWCFFSHHFRQSCNWWVLFSLFQTKLWLVGCNSHQDWPEGLHPQ